MPDIKKKLDELEGCEANPVDCVVMCFKEGIPEKDGWYLVRLVDGHVNGSQRYDVDYCRDNGRSDGGGRGWTKWYPHNISHYAEFDV